MRKSYTAVLKGSGFNKNAIFSLFDDTTHAPPQDFFLHAPEAGVRGIPDLFKDGFSLLKCCTYVLQLALVRSMC